MLPVHHLAVLYVAKVAQAAPVRLLPGLVEEAAHDGHLLRVHVAVDVRPRDAAEADKAVMRNHLEVGKVAVVAVGVVAVPAHGVEGVCLAG